MEQPSLSRRSFLKLTAASGLTHILASCSSGNPKKLTFIDRVLGRPRTEPPQIANSWSFSESRLLLDLSKLPEFDSMGSAVRLESEALADPVLIVLGDDGNYYAFKNACTHAGRMIDPIMGTMTLECCSISSSTFSYAGQVLSGPAKEALTSYPVSLDNGYLSVSLN